MLTGSSCAQAGAQKPDHPKAGSRKTDCCLFRGPDHQMPEKFFIHPHQSSPKCSLSTSKSTCRVTVNTVPFKSLFTVMVPPCMSAMFYDGKSRTGSSGMGGAGTSQPGRTCQISAEAPPPGSRNRSWSRKPVTVSVSAMTFTRIRLPSAPYLMALPIRLSNRRARRLPSAVMILAGTLL